MALYDLLLFAHLLLFAYWLGSDVGVFYGITFVLKPELSPETRQTVMALIHWIDAIPRICFVLMVPLGITLGVLAGHIPVAAEQKLPVLTIAWAAGLMWLAASMAAYQGVSGKLATAEFAFRVLLLAGFLLAGISSFAGHGPVIPGGTWLSAKLILFGGIIGCSLILEILGKPMIAAAGPILQGASTPALEAKLADAVNRSRAVVTVLWALIAILGFLGIAKPV